MIQLLQLLFAEDAVMGDLLKFQQAPVRLKPETPEFVEVAQAPSVITRVRNVPEISPLPISSKCAVPVGAADVEVLANDLFEEDAAAGGRSST